ncbi:spore coat protein CotH [Corallococcus macrosporus DSM 14697]|uniref:Spore coat protein CotH n=1 Tax=Corallococcus macrosporus DSM 14697 TaxID=1189310 RepID=A0A250K4J5_9BACT|nr:spore coat protein CotH [Corallococcus macrosporus DSM 14697]
MRGVAGWWVACWVGLAACGPGDGPAREDLSLEASPSPPWGTYPRVQQDVPTFALDVAPEDLAKLEADPSSDDRVPCVVTLGGARATGQLRFRGASTRELPQKSYKIELDSGQSLEDRDHFHLLASWSDGGKLTEKFAVDLYTAMKLPVPGARYARVSVNGEHQGLYLDMEHVGKDWLRHHGHARDAAIYRCGHRNCELTLKPGPHQGDFDKRLPNDSPGREALDALLAWVNRGDDATFDAMLERHVDVEAYLGNLVADALISNSLIEDSGSFWIHEPQTDRWTYVPWDLNNARMLYWRTANPETPLPVDASPQPFTLYDAAVQDVFDQRVRTRPEQRPTWSVLATRVWERPALRARVLEKLDAALEGPFSEARALAHIDALWKVVEPELRQDASVSEAHARRARDVLRDYVRGRRAWLLDARDALREHGSGPLVIRAIAPGATGFVELYNRGDVPLRLEDYEVTVNLRAPVRHRLPAGGLEPGAAVRLEASGDASRGPLHLPFSLPSEGGEVGVFNATGGSRPRVYGPTDAVWYGPLPAGTVYERQGGGTGEDFAPRRP